jgi:hypothetical protein
MTEERRELWPPSAHERLRGTGCVHGHQKLFAMAKESRLSLSSLAAAHLQDFLDFGHQSEIN